MKIYCAGPIRGNTAFQNFYFEIIKFTESMGHEALTEFGTDYREQRDGLNIYERDIKWLNSADILIAEVSGPSTGVGYEIAYALHHCRIPVLALYHSEAEKVSAMILANSESLLTVASYSDTEELQNMIKKYIRENEK